MLENVLQPENTEVLVCILVIAFSMMALEGRVCRINLYEDVEVAQGDTIGKA